MESASLRKSVGFSRRNKKRVLILGALGGACYGAYKMYNLPSVVERRQKLLKILGALVSVAEMVSDSAEAIGIVSKELKEFMQSNSNEIPQSLKQISKIIRSDTFSESLSVTTKALTVGILQGYHHEASNGDLGFCDQVMNKLFSDAGTGFASVIVGSLARNLVTAVFSEIGSQDCSYQNIQRLIEIVSDNKCKELISGCIQLFVSTAVSVYLEKTMNINIFDEIFSGLTNPKHEARVKDMAISVCNGGVETLLRTSHQIWKRNSKSGFTYKKLDFDEDENPPKITARPISSKKFVDDSQDNNGWVSKMSSTLAVRRNRKFIVDTTLIMTYETIRSFLELFLVKLSECAKAKANADVVHQEVVDRGVEAMKYVTCKSSTVTSVCISLCLRILNAPWILAPW